MADKHFLPSKILTYLRRLELEFERGKNTLLLDIVRSCRVYIREETAYDNWNGGTYGHDAILFLPEEIIKQIPLATQESVQQEILTALNECARGVNNEHFREVQLEMVDERDPEYQRANPLSSRPPTNPDALAIWQPGHLRAFLTHRDAYKKQCNRLAAALKAYGISAFVAHDTIGAMEDWRDEILKGLETMEVMLVFLTDDFDGSTFCNQEVGYALGRGIPIVSLKLGTSDPPGFIANAQAMRCAIDKPVETAAAVYKLMVAKLGQRDRLQPLIIDALINSPSWAATQTRFDRLDQHVTNLTPEQEEALIKGYAASSQLYDCFYLNDRIGNFMSRTTGKEYRIADRQLVLREKTKRALMKELDDEIPF